MMRIVYRALSHRMQNHGIIWASKGEKHEYEMQILWQHGLRRGLLPFADRQA